MDKQAFAEYAELYRREVEACKRKSVPQHVIDKIADEMYECWEMGAEWVGAQGGLQWSPEDGWE